MSMMMKSRSEEANCAAAYSEKSYMIAPASDLPRDELVDGAVDPHRRALGRQQAGTNPRYKSIAAKKAHRRGAKKDAWTVILSK